MIRLLRILINNLKTNNHHNLKPNCKNLNQSNPRLLLKKSNQNQINFNNKILSIKLSQIKYQK